MYCVPVDERPRERLFRLGSDALSDRELLALLLRGGTPGTNVVDLATKLLHMTGGITALSTYKPEELRRLSGVGPAKAATVTAAFGLAKRTFTSSGPPKISETSDIAE